MLTPIALLYGLLLGLVALAIPIAGLALLWKAAHPRARFVRVVRTRENSAQAAEQHAGQRTVPVAEPEQVRPLSWRERWREPSVLIPLLAGVLLVLLPLGLGRFLVQYAFRAGADEPHVLRGESTDLRRPDGTRIHVEQFGPAGASDPGAPILVLTHGWGTDGTEWYYAKRQLAGRFHLIVWDLPGMGETDQPRSQSDALEQMATDLHQVLTLAGGKRVVLVGHSIGGMTNLTFAKLYPEALGPQVAGIVQVDTSYTNPVRTVKDSSLNLALQKPVGEPLLHAMVPLSEVVRAANWLSYQEGLQYLSNAKSAFAGTETRGQLDMVSRFQFESSPGVVARGTLAMFHWDMTPVLAQIHVPVLILVGRQDTTTLPVASETMHRSIPGAVLQVVEPGRHYALLERNREVNDAIARFAGAVLGQAARP